MAPTDEDVFTTWTKDLNGNVTCIYLCGELDASAVPAFLTDTHGITTSGRNVVVDAHLLSYIDSTGLGALFSVKQVLEQKGHGMCLVGCHGLLTKILGITRLDRKMKCYETVDDALAEMDTSGWVTGQ